MIKHQETLYLKKERGDFVFLIWKRKVCVSLRSY